MSTILFFLPLLLVYTVFAVYGERKISAFIQDRYGPMETGKFGILQTVADLLKLVQKENIVPAKADKWPFRFAPVIIFVFVFAGFAVVPVSGNWQGAALETGLFYLLAIVSLDVIGIIMAGWSSNNKYAVLGAIRSASQIISYEVPLTLSVLCVVVLSQTLNLQEISFQQSAGVGTQYLFGIKALGLEIQDIGGILTWNIFKVPVLFPVWIVFFIASLAEANRAPFDLPEAESELIAGFQTEYSGFRWSVIMLAEYGIMLLVSFLGAFLFFGGWNTPLPNIGTLALADWTSGANSIAWGIFWLLTKVVLTVLIQMWVRWTFPRLRIDQLQALGWKYLTPISIGLLFVCALYRLLMI
jgi:NADH-quinone oxidoreductase subunit H